MGGPDTLETQGKRTHTLNGGALRHRRLSKNANIKDRTRRATLQIKIHQQPTSSLPIVLAKPRYSHHHSKRSAAESHSCITFITSSFY